MQGFKDYREYDKIREELLDFIFNRAKYVIKWKNNESKIDMICYIWMYYSYRSKSGYLKVLEKRWSLRNFKENYKNDYEKHIEKINKLDQILFHKYFLSSYEELLDNKKKEIHLVIKDFIINQLTEELFLEFVDSLDRRFEFFFYLFYEKMMDNKNLWEWNELENSFLLIKRKEFNKLCVQLQALK